MLLATTRTAKVTASVWRPVAYRAVAAEPKTSSCTPTLASGTDTGALGAANRPQRTAANSGAPTASADLATDPLPVRRP